MITPALYARRWKCHQSFVCCYKVDAPTCQSPWETHRYGGYLHDMENHLEEPKEVPEPEIPWWDVPPFLLYAVTHDPATVVEEVLDFADYHWTNLGRVIEKRLRSWTETLEGWQRRLDERQKAKEIVTPWAMEAASGVQTRMVYATRANFLADPNRECICGLKHKRGHCDGGR